ncbi:hypothetical protein [Pedobacter sp.]|uniref:hypothetical protein n=1 Tax=Pedobacter sp. TaxID=1411316 RepID=UPI0031D48773
MKKNLLALLLFFLACTSFAQEIKGNNTDSVKNIDKSIKKNEIKLNLLNSILGFPEINYERILTEESSVGLSVAFSLGERANIFLDNYKFMAVPYYRMFFGKNTSGFFIEGNAAVVTSDIYLSKTTYNSNTGIYTYERIVNNETNIGLGAAVGLKFITKSNYIGEILGGAGRFFGDAYHKVYPRIGVSLGKRF